MKKRNFGLLAMLALVISGAAFAGPVNVNTANADTLASELNGIGYSRAQAIVAWRSKHGPFENVEDLQNVKGIGEKIVRMNQGNILFEDTRQ
ncbi:MAG: helix-hairpin-helix domain-containing protein [Gammaproteobacteria bacterium]|nr:helix-hairpin-helix domain-containing protein [Gammaproteobacteria bacterium]